MNESVFLKLESLFRSNTSITIIRKGITSAQALLTNTKLRPNNTIVEIRYHGSLDLLYKMNKIKVTMEIVACSKYPDADNQFIASEPVGFTVNNAVVIIEIFFPKSI